MKTTITEETTIPNTTVWLVTDGDLVAVSNNLIKNLNLNDWVHPDTSERRIYGAAQFVMEMLDDPDHYRSLVWSRYNNYGTSFGMRTYWDLTIPLGFYSDIIDIQDKFLDEKFLDYKEKDELYKKLLSLIQEETKKIFIENDKSNYTRSNEEFWITKIKKGMEELNTHHDDSDFNKTYNDWMYNILYLLHESFWEAYIKKYGEFYRTEQEKTYIETAKVRSKDITVK